MSGDAGTRPRFLRAESVGHSLGIYLPATAIARGMGLVRGIVLAWLITEAEFGLLQLGLLVLQLFHSLCGIGLNEGIGRYVPAHETRGTLRPFLARAFPFGLAIAGVLALAACLNAASFGPILFSTLKRGPGPAGAVSDVMVLTRVTAAVAFGLVAYHMTLAVLKGLRMFRVVSLMEILNYGGFACFAVAAARAGWRTASAIMLVHGMTLGLVVLIFMPVVIRASQAGRASPVDPAETLTMTSVADRLLRFSLWIALATVMWQALQTWPMWYLHKMAGQQGEVTAIYGGVRLLTQGVIIVAAAVITVVQNAVTKTWEAQGPAEADRRLLIAFKTVGLLLWLSCVALVAGRHVLLIILPGSYAAGVAIVPIMLTFFLIGGQLLFLAVHFSLIEKTRYMCLPWLAGLAGTVLAGVMLVKPGLQPDVALRGAAYTGVIGVTVALVVAVILLRAARRPIDRGAWIVLVMAFTLLLPAYVPIVTAGVLLPVASLTNTVFTPTERQHLRERAAALRNMLARFRSRGVS